MPPLSIYPTSITNNVSTLDVNQSLSNCTQDPQQSLEVQSIGKNQNLPDRQTSGHVTIVTKDSTNLIDGQTVVLYPDGITRSYVKSEHDRLFKILSTNDSPTYREYVFLDSVELPQNKPIMFTPEAKRSMTIENAGGKSEYSEALSIQYFQDGYGATDIVPEMEIEYWIDYKMVDFICTIQGYRVGVSVTRAMKFVKKAKNGQIIGSEFFTNEDALTLLHKKLYGMIVARNSVSDKHTFLKSILHIWCQTPQIAQTLKDAYASLDLNDYGLDVQGSVILVLTVCESPGVYRNVYVK